MNSTPTTSTSDGITVEEDDQDLRAHARAWFAERLMSADKVVDEFDVSVFHDLPLEDERKLLDRLREWHQRKWDAGLAGLDVPEEDGGHGRTREAQQAVDDEEAAFLAPAPHELFNVTVHLIAPTVRLYGTPEQRERFAAKFARAEELCVQLFSEPGAGSDLASLATRAERDGGGWVVNGQKVWSSGAQFADHGLVLARTDTDVVKHAGITAFLLPMDSPGVTVRPLRQMSGGASFCEVFLDDVSIADDLRLGDEGEGWRVATTTLSFERDTSGGDTRTGGDFDDLWRTARETGRADDPYVRQLLADAWIHRRLGQVAAARDMASREAGKPQGAMGSLRKLQWTNGLRLVSRATAVVLGTDLVGDTGSPRTFVWTEHVLGTPGYRIAGGTDEIQRNIIAEHVLGLPRGPKVDRGRPWKEVPR